eukprot:GHRQ01022513.1.p1 GENE.GHRQ01022513.1~~GHRQ01022513.1.p1  ORF type:complete len:200 (+),score=77.64 GHRQ01022513.1:33-632(+)
MSIVLAPAAAAQAAVDEARQQLAAGQSVPGILGSLVSAVDEHGNRLTDEQLGDNLLLIMLAGHDTSSTTLTNVMANLHNHPHVVERLREEQCRVTARHGQRITGAILKEMTYADAVIRLEERMGLMGWWQTGLAVHAGGRGSSPLLTSYSWPAPQGQTMEGWKAVRSRCAQHGQHADTLLLPQLLLAAAAAAVAGRRCG